MKIIAVVNQKGGCGKTTSSVNIAAGLALKGKKVLLIDMDPQANATAVFCSNEPELNTYHVVVEGESILKAIVKTYQEGLDILPSDIMLSAADLRLMSVIGREKRLKNAVVRGKLAYDFVIIDTPPSLSILTVNALTCADEVYVPINMSFFALKGVKLLEDTITQVRENLDNPNLEITRVIPTMFDPVTNVSKDVEKMVREYFGDKVFSISIHINVRLEEAHSDRQHIFSYDPKSRGAQQYLQLTEEILHYEDEKIRG